MNPRQGILLVNMGGPANLAGVKPFLTAILEDPFILGLPAMLRIPLSRLIVGVRLKKVTNRYRLIGGGSPLAKWSALFVAALQSTFDADDNYDVRVEYAFRYCSPTIAEALRSLKNDGVQEVILFPLFPHYTRAMTGSIRVIAEQECRKLGLQLAEAPVWGMNGELLKLQKDYLHQAIQSAGRGARVLFVAHGIPLSDVHRGDRYPHQVEETVRELGGSLPGGVSWSLTYSSRLGPLKWVGPYLEDELKRLGEKQDPLVIMQVSFVFDCLETLYDLDIVAVSQARNMGVSTVVRVPSFNDDPRFVAVVHHLIGEALRARSS